MVGLVLLSGGMSVTLAQSGERYEASWESLSKHNEAPEWFKDAKLGIYFHWGVYSVPAFGSEWYPRNMHLPNRKEYKHHIETFGHPSEFGYHDFVPMFKTEHFDAEEWADLFQKAGARFAGPVAEHHDGFSMWGSQVNPWDVYGFGPTTASAGRHGGIKTTNIFTSKDIRFTISKDRRAIYVIFLGKPEPGLRVQMRSFGSHRYPTPTPIKRITLLGTDIEAVGELTDQTFYLTIPEGPMNEMATVFKMELEL